jgi:hypothetical protein
MSSLLLRGKLEGVLSLTASKRPTIHPLTRVRLGAACRSAGALDGKIPGRGGSRRRGAALRARGPRICFSRAHTARRPALLSAPNLVLDLWIVILSRDAASDRDPRRRARRAPSSAARRRTPISGSAVCGRCRARCRRVAARRDGPVIARAPPAVTGRVAIRRRGCRDPSSGSSRPVDDQRPPRADRPLGLGRTDRAMPCADAHRPDTAPGHPWSPWLSWTAPTVPPQTPVFRSVRRMAAISGSAVRCAGRCPVRQGRSAAVGHCTLGLLGSHDCDRQPKLFHAVGQVPA